MVDRVQAQLAAAKAALTELDDVLSEADSLFNSTTVFLNTKMHVAGAWRALGYAESVLDNN